MYPANMNIESFDPDLWQAMQNEAQRQEDHIELIASENYTSPRVLQAQGSLLTNKYAEGYPGKRYYGGCEYVDVVENLAIERLKTLFKAGYANVQPHSGSQANAAVYLALLQPGDTVLGMSLAHGGHLTHGSAVNFSGKLYNFVSYELDPTTERIDYDNVLMLAQKHKPKLIVAGFSAYSRIIDWQIFREIAQSVGAYFMVDMAHVAGLAAVDVYPNPVPIADVTTSTTHKTLRGPRSGIILTRDNDEIAKKISSAVFPGNQGGPLLHVIAAKAVAFKEAMQADFKTYQEQVVKNAQVMANTFMERGFKVVSGGTDNHLLLVDLRSKNITGKDAENVLGRANMTVNKNSVPNDPQSPFITSGFRVGSPAITTRGFKEEQAKMITHLMCDILEDMNNESLIQKSKQSALELCGKFPVYTGNMY